MEGSRTVCEGSGVWEGPERSIKECQKGIKVHMFSHKFQSIYEDPLLIISLFLVITFTTWRSSIAPVDYKCDYCKSKEVGERGLKNL